MNKFDARQYPAYLTPNQYADLMQMHPNTARKMCASGEIPAVKVGRQWRIDKNKALGVA